MTGAALPGDETLAARLAAVRPDDYARTRNRLDGAVTGLSPFVTHGALTLPALLAAVEAAHGPLPDGHRLLAELGWREFFRHVWAREGDAILASLRAGPLPDAAYARTLPADVAAGRTGVPAIDAAVRTLHATGTLHNHARMWLASYLVHLRKVHWRSGADWLYGHLLDGDLASNHLSWQWIAGTFSQRPYLFNAENVERFAPPPWHSRGTVLDASYERLGEIAADGDWVAPAGPMDAAPTPRLLLQPPPDLALAAPDPAAVAGRDVWLLHAWSLRRPPADLPAGTLVVGVLDAAFHRRFGWSERRWRFVLERLAALAPLRWFGEHEALRQALAAARSVRGHADPHLGALAAGLPGLAPPPALFAPVPRPCSSFSQWWSRTRPLRAPRS